MPSILHEAPLNVAASSSTENIDKKEDESFINRRLDDFGKDSSHPLALSDSVKDEKVQVLSKELGLNHEKLMWKIDLCVVPPFCLLYFLAFLDRVNISNAKIYHMESDLGLHGEQFNIALTAFFIPYVIFEVLSNYMLKIIKPHIWLGCMIFLFGIVTICMAYSHSFGGLLTCRLLLGIFEAGSFPSIFYIMANFYTTNESQRRFSIFFSCTCLAGGCAGAIAYRLNNLNGERGLASWQWIYIVEGAITAGLSILLYFIVPDFPEEARFLNQTERKFLKDKLEIYSGKSGFEVKQNWHDVAKVLKEPLVYVASVAYFSLIVPAYSYAYFAPSIIKEMGYTALSAQAHSIYPWLASLGFSIILAFIADRTKLRSPYAIASALIAIAGLVMVYAGKDNINVKYGGCFLVALGLYSCMPVLICWMSLNFTGHIRKSIGTAFVIGFGNIGGIVSSFIFPNNEAPRYKKGLGICLGFTALSIFGMLIYQCVLMHYTSRKKSVTYCEKWEKLSEREKIMKGDLNPDFRYQY